MDPVVTPQLWELPLVAIVSILAMKEAFGLVKWTMEKRHGGNGKNGHVTPMDIERAKNEILTEVRAVSERVARLEGARGIP